jgi:hypothetical protein
MVTTSAIINLIFVNWNQHKYVYMEWCIYKFVILSLDPESVWNLRPDDISVITCNDILSQPYIRVKIQNQL